MMKDTLHKGTPIKEVPQIARADMVPIDSKGKYLLHINFGPVPHEQRVRLLAELKKKLYEWWRSDEPVFIITTWGQPLKIYRVDEEENNESDKDHV
jgi:hypothetical protein